MDHEPETETDNFLEARPYMIAPCFAECVAYCSPLVKVGDEASDCRQKRHHEDEVPVKQERHYHEGQAQDAAPDPRLGVTPSSELSSAGSRSHPQFFYFFPNRSPLLVVRDPEAGGDCQPES